VRSEAAVDDATLVGESGVAVDAAAVPSFVPRVLRGSIVGGGGEAGHLGAPVVLHYHNLVLSRGEERPGDIQRLLRSRLE
jgi:hypothetical protein